MKLQQDDSHFEPITLTLDKRFEAEAFLSLMDKICNCFGSVSNDITPDRLTEAEKRFAIAISDAFTEGKVKL